MARKEKAALFILEHRYYGESKPTTTITSDEIQWLSSRYDKKKLAKNRKNFGKSQKVSRHLLFFEN